MRPAKVLCVALPLFVGSAFRLNAQAPNESMGEGRITFYSARKAWFATRDIVCTLSTTEVWNRTLTNSNATGVDGRRCRDDRANFLSVVGPAAAGTIIRVFKHPRASTTEPGNSAWTEIRLLVALPAGQALIVGSFDQSLINPLFSARRYGNLRNDGRRYCPWDGDCVDGKISWIGVFPPGMAEELAIDDAETIMTDDEAILAEIVGR